MAQEAVDRFLAAHGGVEGLIERGLAALAIPASERGGGAARADGEHVGRPPAPGITWWLRP